jgi:acyl-CoA thioester hydrolase
LPLCSCEISTGCLTRQPDQQLGAAVGIRWAKATAIECCLKSDTLVVHCAHPPYVAAWRRYQSVIWLPFMNTVSLVGKIARAKQSIMLDRLELEPLFFAPFVSSLMRVEPAWIDYNGHLNMAYYNVLFDRAVDEVFELLGCGLDYVREHKHSCFTAEVHVRYLRELHAEDPVRVTFQLLDYDQKRMHYFEQLFHAGEGWVSATSENMSLHVDMTAKRTLPFPDSVAAALGRMQSAHSRLPRPAAAGRRIAMPGKGAA